MVLKVPWEITVVEKGTLGQAARMAAVGTKKAALKVPNVKPAGKPSLGQASRMAAPKSRMKGVPSWANRPHEDTGPLLSLKSNGFEPLTKPPVKRDLVPTIPKGGSPKLAPGAQNKSKTSPLSAPAAIAGVGLAAGVGAGIAQQKFGGGSQISGGGKKKKVSKAMASNTINKPAGMKKPAGVLKPVTGPKPMAGPKPVKPTTPATGAQQAAAPAAPKPLAPPPTMIPPSMMPQKPAPAKKPGAQR